MRAFLAASVAILLSFGAVPSGWAASNPRAVTVRVKCHLEGVSGGTAGTPDCHRVSGWFEGRVEWRSGGTTLFQESGPFFGVAGGGDVTIFLDGNGDEATFRAVYEDPASSIFRAPELTIALYLTDHRGDHLVLQHAHIPVASALWAVHSEDTVQLGLDLATEREARAAAEAALQAGIAAEAAARAQADASLATQLETRLGSLDAASLVSGTVPAARLSGTYAIDIGGNAATATTAAAAGTATTATDFTGALGGDVTGAQASTLVTRLRGVLLSSGMPVSGQVLSFDGSMARWTTPSPPSGGLTLPYTTTVALSQTAFSINNVIGGAAQFTGGSGGTGAVFVGGSGGAAAGDGIVARGGSVVSGATNGGAGGSFTGGSGTTGGAPGIVARGGSLPFGGGVSAPGIVAFAGAGSDPVAGRFVGGVDVSGDVDVSGGVNVNGNVHVAGILSAGSKAFKIDHPLDPRGKYLSHAVVESSEMLNIYSGVAILDAEGQAVVALPAWFEALNGDFRYQLTAVGAPAPNLFIAEEVAQNRFKIAGGKPGAKVSWQVSGVRQDAYARAHPIRVEEDKPRQQLGRYLHPEAFGQAAR